MHRELQSHQMLAICSSDMTCIYTAGCSQLLTLETSKQGYGICINNYNHTSIQHTLIIMFCAMSGISLCLACVHASVLKTPDTVFRMNCLRETREKRGRRRVMA